MRVCTAGDRRQHIHAKERHADGRSSQAWVFLEDGEDLKVELDLANEVDLARVWAPVADRAEARALGDRRQTWPVHVDTDHEVPFRHLHRLAVELRRAGVKQVRLDARPLPGWSMEDGR